MTHCNCGTRAERNAAKAGFALFLFLLFALIGLCMYGAIRAENRREVSHYSIPNYPTHHHTIQLTRITYREVWV